MFIKPLRQLDNGAFIFAISLVWLCASLFMVYSGYMTVGVFVAWLSGALCVEGIHICNNPEQEDNND
jgi:hypothetical protein